jgi:RecA/RadA recombinase
MKMSNKNIIIDKLTELTKKKGIISLSGGSGTGKTTFALYFIGNSLTSSMIFSESCIWIQASEIFPKKRLESLFKNHLEKWSYLNQNIFIIPRKNVCVNYQEQASLILNIISGKIILPPNVRFIVIDNLSHHLRYLISKKNNIEKITATFNDFFTSQLLPLILFCNREHIILILIHEISYDIKTNTNKPYFFKLYERIDSITITFEKQWEQSRKIMHITSDHFNKAIPYHIIDQGFLWQE